MLRRPCDWASSARTGVASCGVRMDGSPPKSAAARSSHNQARGRALESIKVVAVTWLHSKQAAGISSRSLMVVPGTCVPLLIGTATYFRCAFSYKSPQPTTAAQASL